MLLEFRVENFRSFAEEVIFDMRATGIREQRETLNVLNGVEVLPVAAIYGANASGKSNLFAAIVTMKSKIQDKNDKDDKNNRVSGYIVPNIFDVELSKKPTTFEITIEHGGYEYRYGFSCDKMNVYSEWLYKKPFKYRTKAKDKCIFIRNGKKLETPDANKSVEKELNFCFDMLANNQLLLYVIGARSRVEIAILVKLLSYELWDLDFSKGHLEDTLTNFTLELLDVDKEMQKWVVGMLQEIDPAIEGIEIEKKADSNQNYVFSARTRHVNSLEKPVLVDLDNESCGTRKYFVMAIIIALHLSRGGTLLIDELDAKIHPLLLRKIARMFTDKKINVGNGQLVFSAHNLICLDSSDLRRDEIWFVEKNNQKSELYSLADFRTDEKSVRSDLDFSKHYLSGRFGAVPFRNEDE